MVDYVGSIHVVLAAGLPMSVAETQTFSNQAKGILSENDIADLKIELALNPTKGVVIPGTGGVRKYRIPHGSKGKSGGARVIHYFHDREMPIYLLAIYSKAEKINLSDVERAMMRKLEKELVTTYRIRDMPKMIS
jgi:hypothetical protein